MREIVAENIPVGKRGETPLQRICGSVRFAIRKHRDKSAYKQCVANHILVLRPSPLQGCCGTAGGVYGERICQQLIFNIVGC